MINFEVWLPADWNGKFDHAGNGGWGGGYATANRLLVAALLRGYATAATNMGHVDAVTPGGSFALGHPEKLADWAYRANHVTSIIAKLVIKAFYGAGPALSYFTGCSDGGHEALMEAQRYPTTTTGSWRSAGQLLDPSVRRVDLGRQWGTQSPVSKLPMITAAALAACPAFSPVHLRSRRLAVSIPARCCAGADAPNCLTANQVTAVRKIYDGPRNPRTNELIYPASSAGAKRSKASGRSPVVARHGDATDVHRRRHVQVHRVPGSNLGLQHARLRPRRRVGRLHSRPGDQLHRS